MDRETKHKLIELVKKLTHIIGDIEIRFIKSLGEAGLTARQLDYLETINRLGHPAFSELAAELELSRPSVTAIIERFVSQGYVERVRSDEDRRSAHVHLTENGREIISMHEQAHVSIAGIFLRSLGRRELDELVKILAMVVKE